MRVYAAHRLTPHRDVRDAVLEELLAVDLEAERRVPGTPAATGRPAPRRGPGTDAQRRVHERGRPARGRARGGPAPRGRSATRRRRRAPARSRPGRRRSCSSTCRVAGLDVAAVEVGVRALLLDDEHVLPQPPHVVAPSRVEAGRTARRPAWSSQELQRSCARPACLGDAAAAAGRRGSGPAPRRRRGPSRPRRRDAASSRQPGTSRSRVPQNISVGGSPARSAEAGDDLGPAQVVRRAGPPLGVRAELAEEQPRVDGVERLGLGRAGRQVDPRREQHHPAGLRPAAVAQRQRQRERVAAARGVADRAASRRSPRPTGRRGRPAPRGSRARCARARAGSRAARPARRAAIASRAT